MEPILQLPQQGKIAVTKKSGRYAVITGVLVLFGALLLLLTFKPSSKADEKPVAITYANIAWLENNVEINPNYNNLVTLSVAYINEKKPFRAIPYLKEALKSNPNSALVYNNLGVAHIMLGNYAPAIENCEKSISLDTSFKLAKNNLRWAIAEKNKVLISLQELEKMPEAKRTINYYIECSIKYLAIGDYEDCIAACRIGLVQNPGNVALLNNTGMALMMQKKYESAILQFEKVLEKDAGNKLAKNIISWAIDEKRSGQ